MTPGHIALEIAATRAPATVRLDTDYLGSRRSHAPRRILSDTAAGHPPAHSLLRSACSSLEDVLLIADPGLGSTALDVERLILVVVNVGRRSAVGCAPVEEVEYLRNANIVAPICIGQGVSLAGPDTPITPEEPPEPDPFTAEEFSAWRGMLRVHSAVFRELDRQLASEHGFGIDSYGVLITLLTAPEHRLPIGELGLRRNLSPSGISRSIDRLTKLGLTERVANPDDGRSLLVALTPDGLRRLRESQVTHHRVVREMLLAHLGGPDLKRLAALWEKAMPGAVSSPTWPL